ncbi:MAG: hypothetical protein Q4C06_07535 [Bacillota bacterium]|nr:hypothetical protein [Bacillota bacterium]
MQALSDKGSALKAKFKKFQKLSLVLYALAAMAFVFAGNIPLAIILVALDIFLEVKLYVCPHCGKGLDCRKRVHDDAVCPRCQKYLFRGL